MNDSLLAILGGNKAVTKDVKDSFSWPIITEEDSKAVLDVLSKKEMSEINITEEFEKKFADWLGIKYALASNNGTSALHSAMWACGVKKGTEIIAPTITYWATAMPALSLGAAINFVDINPITFNIDVNDIEHRINKKTKAIIVVHYAGYPCEMDTIMNIALKYKLKVIEDCSHAHGGLYSGKKVGTIGDVAAMSLMTGKSFGVGEGGMLVTNCRETYERAIAFGHYERTEKNKNEQYITDSYLKQYAGIPLGGYKYRINQFSSAIGLVQLKHYDERMKEIQRAMNYFSDLLEEVPGLIGRRPQKDSNCTMAGWYGACIGYNSKELGGLHVQRFCDAVAAEGVNKIEPGLNYPLHKHPIFHSVDIYGDDHPNAVLTNTNRDIRKGENFLKVAEDIKNKSIYIPWFKKYYPDIIEEHAKAFKKVAENYKKLL